MKRKLALISMIVMIALLLSAFGVLAAAPSDKPAPKSPSQHATVEKPDHKNQKKGKVQNYKGIVAAKETSSLTLTLKDGSTVALGVDSDTKVKIPTLKNATIDAINLESQVMVQARADSTGALIAQKIQVIPGKPTKIHRVGVVTEYTAGSSITIEAKDGSTTSFLLDDNTRILPQKSADRLAVGDQVTIISRRDPTGGALLAQGGVIHGGEDGED